MTIFVLEWFLGDKNCHFWGRGRCLSLKKFGIEANWNSMKAIIKEWLGDRDSNPDKQSQSLLSCR